MLYGLSVGLLIAGAFLTDLRLWSIGWYAYFDWTVLPIVALVAVAVPLGLMRLYYHDRASGDSGSRFTLIAAIVIAVMAVAYYLLRARMHFLGDGYLLLGRLADHTAPIRPWNPGIYWIQSVFNQVFGDTGKDSALAAFQTISIGSGVLLLVATSLTAAKLYHSTLPRLLFLLGVASGGYALLFFGYVENYPLFLLMTGLFGLLGLLAAYDHIHPLWTLLPLLAALPLHPFGVAMIPPAVYLIGRKTPPGRMIGRLPLWIKAVLVSAVGAVGVYAFLLAYNASYFFRFSIVPLVENRFTIEGYWMFSGKHLLDLLNLLWQLQPALLLTALLLWWRRSSLGRPVYRFLLLLLASTLGIALLFDPKLGMPRDWDLFASTGIPLVLLTLTAALDHGVRSTTSVRTAVLAVALGLLTLIPRAIVPSSPDMSIAMLDDYADLDVYKNGGGRFLLLNYLDSHGRKVEADRRRTENASIAKFEFLDREGQALMRQGNIGAAITKYHELLRDYPTYPNAWTNLGICYYQIREYDSATACLRISDGLNPYNFYAYHYLALSLYASGHDKEAEQRWKEAIWLNPTDYRPCIYLLLMYDYGNRPEDYDHMADSILSLAAHPDAHVQLVGKAAEIYLRRGNVSQGTMYATRALQLGVGKQYICDLQKRYPELQLVDCES